MWDVFRVGEDAQKLRDYGFRHAAEFIDSSQPVSSDDLGDTVFDQRFYLGSKHREKLSLEEGVSALSLGSLGFHWSFVIDLLVL